MKQIQEIMDNTIHNLEYRNVWLLLINHQERLYDIASVDVAWFYLFIYLSFTSGKE